jgi:hypothetical protein
VLLATLALAGASAARPAALERSTVDRPDEVAGRQVHAIYVVPKDGRDRRLDVNGSLEATLWSSQGWLAGAAEGFSLRMDTFRGRFDISFLRSSQTSSMLKDQQYRIVNALREDLRSGGFTRKPNKVALVLYDGPMARPDGGRLCGVSLGRESLPRIALANFRSVCGPLRPTGLFSLRDKTIPHEVFHATGQVPDSAPNSDGDGHSTDPTDMMYGEGVTMRKTEALRVDPGHDDYWTDVLPWLTRNHLALRVAAEGRGSVHTFDLTNRQGSVRPCGRCTFWHRRGARVLVLPTPRDQFSRFDHWGGACTGRIQCIVSVTRTRLVTAAFVETGALGLTVRGPGTVRVAGHPPCSSYCGYQFEPHRRVTFVAVPGRGAKFVKWADGCTKGVRCELVVRPRRNHWLTAVFAKRR